ncbi:MAG TPA: adenylate/guanylate cyclase domain-containing protein [Chloroflexi bacterium]|nr:adenylate/guanylate cyclase domain-containing protein [Chloroflexota bacterium]
MAEGRQIKRGSALIADVVNFYGQELRSLEAIADVLDDLYNTLASTVTSHRGEVVKWLGDGALACFWESGHEHDAVRAALGLQKEFEGFIRRHGFERSGLTISVASGEMIVGTFGTGIAAHYDVFGEPVNCTATIMPGASGAITICEATYRAVSGSVSAELLAEHEYFGPLYAVRSGR